MDKRHYLHSRNGCIGNGTDTSIEDLDELVRSLCADQRHHLVLHFHGGLVSKNTGIGIAEKLLPVYSPMPDKGGYPVFFVWESGAWETIRNNLTELADEPVFKQVLRKLVQYALEKVGGHVGVGVGRSIPQAGCGALGEETKQAFNAFWEIPSKSSIPFIRFVAVATGAQARAASQEINEEEILADLQGDEAFQRAMASLPGLPAATRSVIAPGVEEHRSEFSVKAAELFSGQSGTRGVIELFQVVKFIVKVLKAVLHRYAGGRDHGLYATCVEEIVRAFKIGGSGINHWGQALEWNRMKQDTLDAFGPDPDVHVGTALLSRLKAAMDTGSLTLNRITLVGHSTGAIYIAHWLEHCSAYLPTTLHHNVVYLAPAITYDLFAQTLFTNQAPIANFRMFAMKDALERDDQVWGSDEELEGQKDWRRFLYPSSLLYLVSGILETNSDEHGIQVDAPDMPLLGMQRFFIDDRTYSDSDFESIGQVRAWAHKWVEPFVWSNTTGNRCGLNSESIDHGAFDDDPTTLTSLGCIIESGF